MRALATTLTTAHNRPQQAHAGRVRPLGAIGQRLPRPEEPVGIVALLSAFGHSVINFPIAPRSLSDPYLTPRL